MSAIGAFRRHPFLRLLMPLVVGIWFGELFPCSLPLWACLVALFLPVLSLIINSRRYCRWLYGVAVHLSLAFIGFQLMSRQLEQTQYPFSGKAEVYKIRVLENPEPKERSILCRAVWMAEGGQSEVSSTTRHNIFLFYFPKDSMASALKRGDEVLVKTRLSPPVNNGNPDEFDYARYLKHKGVTGTASVAAGHWRVAGHDASRSFRQVASDYRAEVVALYARLGLGRDELAVLSALTIGAKDDLSDDILETYSVTGASHVLALSGLHIGFFYALFLFLFSFLWKRWRCLKPFLLFIIILFLWSFAFLTGLSSSVVRSVVMFSFLALACLQPEKPLTLNTLAATAFLMLLCCPVWLFDVGFQLSFSAVAAIVVLQPKLYALVVFRNRFLRSVWGLITVSIAAQVGTAPLVMLYFSRFSTHFLLTNLWVIPMVSLILYSAVLLWALTPFPFLQQAFSGVVEAFVRAQNTVLHRIEQLPLASVDDIWIDAWEVSLFYLFIGLICRSFMRRTARAVSLALFVLLLMVSYHSVSGLLCAPRKSIAFYNVRGCPAVHCLTDGSKSWLACADSLPDLRRLFRSLSPHWNRMGLEEPQVITGDYFAEELSVGNRLLRYSGKCICLLHDNRWRNKSSVHSLSIDYLYISKGYSGSLCDLSSLFSVKTVVLDASLSAFVKERLAGECIRLGIPYLSLSEKGSVCILL